MKPAQQTPPKYPLGTVIAYGPDDRTATKLVAAVFSGADQKDPVAMEKWIVQGGDIRQDTAIGGEVAAFLKRHEVKHTAAYDRIFGCPHEEGIDYPEGGVCPHCPFWAEVDRYTGEPKSASVKMSVDQILADLSVERDTQPLEALAAAEAHREALTPRLLTALERGIADPQGTPPGEALLFSYASYLLAKWREPRAYPLFIRWLSLPGDGAGDIGGDTVTQGGSRLLASVCGGDLEPIKGLILNRDAYDFCRGQAVEALAVLVAWGELPQEQAADYFLWLAREGLEREFSQVWNDLAVACADIEALAVFPDLRRAFGEGLIERFCMRPEELDEVESEERGEALARFRERNPPITDVAKETSWWSYFYEKRRAALRANEVLPEADLDYDLPAQPYIAPPKPGRNDPCPCGSGKKYKKCCGR